MKHLYKPVACDGNDSADEIAVAFVSIVVLLRSQCNGNFEQTAAKKHWHAPGMVANVALLARLLPDDWCTMTECDYREPTNVDSNFATMNLICVDRLNMPSQSEDHDATVN